MEQLGISVMMVTNWLEIQTGCANMAIGTKDHQHANVRNLYHNFTYIIGHTFQLIFSCIIFNSTEMSPPALSKIWQCAYDSLHCRVNCQIYMQIWLHTSRANQQDLSG